MTRVIVFLILIWGAMRLGTIWDSQANPIQNVTIQLDRDMAMKGSLTYTLLGQYALQDESGKVYIFDSSAIKYESRLIEKDRSMWVHWRSFVPVCLVAFFGLLIVLPVELAALVRSLKPSSNESQSGGSNP